MALTPAPPRVTATGSGYYAVSESEQPRWTVDDSVAVLGAGIILVALAVLTVVVTARRPTGVGVLSRETRRADRSSAWRTPTPEPTRRASPPPAPSPPAPPPLPRPPVDAGTYGVTRRQFFNRGIVSMFGLGLSGFFGSTLAFLWPQTSGGFGSKIRAGSLTDILARASADREPLYVAEGRFYVGPYPDDAVSKAAEAYSPSIVDGMRQGWSPSTRSAPTSAAGCRGARPPSGSSARAMVRSTTGWARRMAPRRPAGWTGSRSPSTTGSWSSTPA